MPDFTYVAYRPLVTRLLSAAAARALTIKAMAVQSRSAGGRALFGWMAAADHPSGTRRRVLGIDFPSPIGVAPHVDLDGSALRLWPRLGAGFTVIGPVRSDAPNANGDLPIPMLVHRLCGIVCNDDDASTDIEGVYDRLGDPLARDAPVGVSVCGDDVAGSLKRLGTRADFFYVPTSADPEVLACWRAATDKPLLLRIAVSTPTEEATHVAAVAVAQGFDGVVLDGSRCDLLPSGREHGPFARDPAMALIARLRRTLGERAAIVAGVGVMTPGDAKAALDAGASLVSLFEGFVYAGPGLPRRANALLDGSEESETQAGATTVSEEGPRAASNGTWRGAALGALLMGLAGLFVLVLAATKVHLGYETMALGMSGADIEAATNGHMMPFIAHNRVCLASALLCTSIVAFWIAWRPLRRGEAWAWWATLVSAIGGFVVHAAALSARGMIDPYMLGFHGAVTALVLGSLAAGWSQLPTERRSMTSLIRPGAKAWLWSPASRGRALVGVWAAGQLVGGALILFVGLTTTLVPQDVGFLGFGMHHVHAVHGELGQLIAKDRILFGVILFSSGLLLAPAIWCGIRPGERGLLVALGAALVVQVGLSVGVHPIIGYHSFDHLAPFLAKAVAFAAGATLLWGPMGAPGGGETFPDLWVDAGPPRIEPPWAASPQQTAGCEAA